MLKCPQHLGVEMRDGGREVSSREGEWLNKIVEVFRKWGTNFSAQPSVKVFYYLRTSSQRGKDVPIDSFLIVTFVGVEPNSSMFLWH